MHSVWNINQYCTHTDRIHDSQHLTRLGPCYYRLPLKHFHIFTKRPIKPSPILGGGFSHFSFHQGSFDVDGSNLNYVFTSNNSYSALYLLSKQPRNSSFYELSEQAILTYMNTQPFAQSGPVQFQYRLHYCPELPNCCNIIGQF